MKGVSHNKSSGFTLVELAVVLVIIGLITAGILKFQQFLNHARATAVIADTRAITNAFQTFRDKYDSLPGDMAQATARIPDCTTTNNCFDGGTQIGPPIFISGRLYAGGDGIVGGHGLFNDQSAVPQETTQFWRHLLLADLISGVSTSAQIAWGESHPAVRGLGGFHVQYTLGWPRQGHWLRLQNPVRGNPFLGAGQNAISPMQASYIDRKTDDGNVTDGYVVGKGQGCGGTISGPSVGTYDETETNQNCLLFFKFF